jgi:hypothetical protein
MARNALMAAQVAIALTLCIGAGLMTRSLYDLVRVDVGFGASNLLTFQLQFPKREYTRRFCWWPSARPRRCSPWSASTESLAAAWRSARTRSGCAWRPARRQAG